MASPRKLVPALVALFVLAGSTHGLAQPGDAPATAEAGQPAEKPDKTESSGGPSTSTILAEIESELKALEANLKEIEANPGMPAETKTAVSEEYRLAITRLEQTREKLSNAEKYARSLVEDPPKTTAIRTALAEAAQQTPEAASAIPPGTTSKELDAALASLEREFVQLRGQLATKEGDLDKQKKRPQEVRDQIALARSTLAGIDAEEREPVEGIAPELARARELRGKARRRYRRAEIDELTQELASHSVRLELLTAERDELQQQVKARTARAQAIQEAANRLRSEEAEQERRRAEEARRRAQGDHQVVQDLARENVDLTKELEDLGTKIASTTESTAAIVAQRSQIEESFKVAKQRLDKAGLSDVIGRILRAQRRELPNPRDYVRETRQRENDISLVELELIDIEERCESLEDFEAAVQSRMAQVETTIDPNERARIEAAVRELLARRARPPGVAEDPKTTYLLPSLEASYKTYLDGLGKLDTEQKDLMTKSQDYATFLDENLLWIRSSDPLKLKTAGDTLRAVYWLGRPSAWIGALESAIEVVRRRPGPSLLTLLSVLVLFVARHRLRRLEREKRTRVGKVQSDGFQLTLQALLAEAVTVLPGPLLLFFFAWNIRQDPATPEFSKAAASGLLTAAILLLAFHSSRRLIRRDGVAQLHFRWRLRSLEALRRPTLWLVAWTVALPAAILVSMTDAQSNEAHRDSIGRIAFMVLMGAVAWIVSRVLHPGRGALAERIELEPEGWMAKLRTIWYPLAVGTPLGLIVLAALGYVYTSLELGGQRLQLTILLFLVALLLQNLIQRWLYVAHRRMAWEKALEERKARLAAAAATTSASSASTASSTSGAATPQTDAERTEFEVVMPEVDLKQISEQARHLLGALVGTSVIVGLWLIWASVLPALQVLDEAELWQYTTTTAEGQKLEWITLKHVAMAGIFGLITLVASRNIPGALELTILQKLPIEPGGRYAIATVGQYVIIGVGIVVAFNAIGIGWSQVQWLVAAVSLGLGFGLQEIFANFVSGVILLLERPIRVGDIVTIGDVTGVVTRIRMRATTVRNWDRKELVVPNKEFITGRLLNWTLSDATNRIVIQVGVAYGSNTELARSLLLQVANDHPLILKDPPAAAVFEGFADSSLTLVLRCFLPDLQNRLPVIHELHTAIDRAFRDSGIEIAFPQRDLHLRSADADLRLVDRERAPWSVDESGRAGISSEEG